MGNNLATQFESDNVLLALKQEIKRRIANISKQVQPDLLVLPQALEVIFQMFTALVESMNITPTNDSYCSSIVDFKLAGELGSHATAEMKKVRNRFTNKKFNKNLWMDEESYLSKIKKKNKKNVMNRTAKLLFPILRDNQCKALNSKLHLINRVELAALLEYLIAEVLNLAGENVLNCDYITIFNIQLAVDEDEELDEMIENIGFANKLFPDNTSPHNDIFLRYSKHTQAIIAQINQSQWYNSSDDNFIDNIVQQILSGEIKCGSEYSSHNIRLDTYYGKHKHYLLGTVNQGTYWDAESEQYGEVSFDQTKAIRIMAFQITDARGHEYNLIMEMRLNINKDDIDLEMGSVYDRVNRDIFTQYATITFNKSDNAVIDATEFISTFPDYQPHNYYPENHTEYDSRLAKFQFKHNFENMNISPEYSELSESHAIRNNNKAAEVERLLALAYSAPEYVTDLWQYNHPPAIVKQFTNAVYKHTFQDLQIDLPSVLIGLIIEYYSIQLPYIPSHSMNAEQAEKMYRELSRFDPVERGVEIDRYSLDSEDDDDLYL